MSIKQILTGIAVLGLLIVFSGCAHSSHERGSVVMRERDNKVHVCLGEGQVEEGDKVNFYKSVCTSSDFDEKGSRLRTRCEKVRIAEGTVIEVMDEHFSTVEVFGSLLIPEGSIVEKN